jgi:hypothetical protein
MPRSPPGSGRDQADPEAQVDRATAATAAPGFADATAHWAPRNPRSFAIGMRIDHWRFDDHRALGAGRIAEAVPWLDSLTKVAPSDAEAADRLYRRFIDEHPGSPMAEQAETYTLKAQPGRLCGLHLRTNLAAWFPLLVGIAALPAVARVVDTRD